MFIFQKNINIEEQQLIHREGYISFAIEIKMECLLFL